MRKQADGRFKTKVVVGTRADGTKVIKWITAKTKRELQEKRQAVLIKYRDGSAAAPADIMATEWIYRWFDTVAAPGQKPQTAKDIRAQIARHIEPRLADKQLRAVTFFDLQECVNGLAGKGRTLTSNMVGIIKRSFAAACSQGYVPRDVSVGLSARLPARQHNRAFTDDEILIIKKNLAERRTEPLLMALFFYTGMRRGEVIGLQWKDVDMKNDVIRVRKDFDYKTNKLDSLKTENAERDIPIVPALKEILKDYQGIGDAFVIHAPSSTAKPLCEATLKRKWKKIQALLGEDVTTRTFRNNFATVMYDVGVDVLTAAKAMGHADPTTTLKIYTDLDRSRKVQRGYEAVKNAFDSSEK